MAGDLRRLARQRLQRLDVRRAVSPPSVLQYLLYRWRAELSCALLVGDMGVYLDALQGGPGPGVGEPARVETRLYDLQPCRIGY